MRPSTRTVRHDSESGSQMGKKLGVVADDLTGAMDTAGAFAARGLPTLVSLSSDSLPGAGWDVLCSNTQTRNAPLPEAWKQVRSATRSLVQGGYSRLFKKIDSTLRGNVGAEVDAMMDESSAPYAFVVPAFPDTGRTQRDGILYVGGTPLSAAPEGKDRLSAPASSSVVELMEQQTSKPVGLVSLSTVDEGQEGIMSAVGRLVTDGVRMVTVDAVAPTHIVDIVAALTRGFPDGLLVGSAGLAGALAKGMGQSGPERSKPTATVTPGPVLVVSGSVNPVSVAQVERLVTSTRIRPVTMTASAVLGDEGDRSQEVQRVSGEVRDTLESGEDVCLTWSSSSADLADQSDAP